MLFANDYNEHRVHIDDTHSNQAYYCPYCGQQLIVRKGEVRRHHFAHRKNVCTDTWETSREKYDISDWHYEWQSLFPKDNQEIKLSLGETCHRADVLVDRTVIEFQHSILSEKCFDDRNNFYHNLGYKVVWLFDLTEQIQCCKITIQKGENRLHFHWKNPKRAFNSYDIRNGNIELYFQIYDKGTDSVVRVIDVSERGFEYFYTSFPVDKNDFLRHVGLIEGKCALPYRYDVEANQIFSGFCDKYSISLNSQQQRALLAVEGANLLLAVPGSGKTKVLVERLGYMVLCKGINPKDILAITFTDNAADEMRMRFSDKFGAEAANEIDFRTINSLCYEIYRKSCPIRGKGIRQLITDNRNILRRVIREYYSYASENDIQELRQNISYIKNMMLDNGQIKRLAEEYPHTDEMYRCYIRQLESDGLMDYDDQMLFAYEILKRYPSFLLKLQAKYRYISVDEAQDTSKIQHAVIRMIAQGNNNIFMVGDEDQSIYGFRAAYPRALLNFRYDYINPYILQMECNYRSTPEIAETAANFIAQNSGRYNKRMKSMRESGCPVSYIICSSREEQYNKVLAIAKQSENDTAFLYRDNESSVILVDLMHRNGVPFRIKAPRFNFFKTRTVLFVLAFFRLAVKNDDTEALKILCKKSTRLDMIKKKASQLSSLSPYDAIESIVSLEFGDNLCYGVGGIDVLAMLAKQEPDIPSFLSRMHLLEDIIMHGVSNENPKAVTLSTIHSAKGLEFNTVYMIDVYDGRFPASDPNIFSRSKDNADGEQEERRLFYVGMTRAKNKLAFFSIDGRRSSYIEELFPDIKERRIETEIKRIEEENKKRLEREAAERLLRETEIKEMQKRAEREQRIQQERDKNACREEIEARIDIPNIQARDHHDRRWVKCEKCGIIALEEEFAIYGGETHYNRGICKECQKQNTGNS